MPSSAVDRETIEGIFRALRGRFGNAFIEKFRTGQLVPDGLPFAGKDIGLLEAMDVWAHELRGLSAAEIQNGLKSRFKFPPSADEFVEACCQLDYSALPNNERFAALPAPKLTRDEAEQRLSTLKVGRNVGRNTNGVAHWRHVGEHADQYPQLTRRMAFEALIALGCTIPAALAKYFPTKEAT